MATLCAVSYLTSCIFSFVKTHGHIHPYRVATLISITCNQASMAFLLSTMMFKNSQDIIYILVEATLVDGWGGTKDALIDSELEVRADIKVVGFPSP